MPRRPAHRLAPPALLVGLACALCVAAASCSPRIGVYEATSPQLSLDVEGTYSMTDSVATVTYELWSAGGAPWVSMRNEGDAELLLDLAASRLRYGDVVTTLDERPSRSLDGRSLSERFAKARIERRDGRTWAVIPPAAWIGFELPGLTLARCRRNRQSATGHCATFTYVLRERGDGGAVALGSTHTLRHELTGARVASLRRSELAAFERQEASERQYYEDVLGVGDTGAEVGAQVVVQVLSALLSILLL